MIRTGRVIIPLCRKCKGKSERLRNYPPLARLPPQRRRKADLKQPGISNHALRHTAGTLGYLHTGDLRAVQDFLGHADPRMTAKYAHVVDMAKKNPALFIPVKVG